MSLHFFPFFGGVREGFIKIHRVRKVHDLELTTKQPLWFLPAKAANDHSCSLPVEEAGIIWDSICFLFLLLQRRVFLSFYFLHVVTDLQASAKQASR